MLVSVLVANHNYALFVPEAIDSALSQTYPAVEVVVVDDGSTDESRDVLESYGDRIVSVFQPQGGQASALNTAFECSRGELVCLLDADDVFEADKVASLVAAWRQRPKAAMLHHQMQLIDGAGRLHHAPFPRVVLEGDLRRRVQRSGGWFPHGLTSALAFPRSYLHRLFPIPTATRVIATPAGPVEVELKADTYLASPAPFLAPVAGVAKPLTRYRMHDRNKSQIGGSRADAQRRRRGQCVVEYEALLDVLQRFGVTDLPRLEDHLPFTLVRCSLGEVRRSTAVISTLRSAGLPASLKPREAARVALGKGTSEPA
jgi:hypothetical protein